MTSAARIAANRRNALASTGPRTSAGKARAAQNAELSTGPRTSEGKARAAQNALRHRLTHSAAGDPAWSNEIMALARSIAGADADPARYELACRIAEAQIDVMRARRARTDLCSAVVAALGEGDGIARLAAIADYEWRALARRNRAIRAFDAHDDRVLDDRVLGKRTEPNPAPATATRENEPNPTRKNKPNPIRENEPNPRPAGTMRENEPNPTKPESVIHDW